MSDKRLARTTAPQKAPSIALSKNVQAGSLSVEDALLLAGRLNAAEKAGWPKGFDPEVISRYWNEIIWTLNDDFLRVQASTPELSGVLFRQYMRALDPSWKPSSEQVSLPR